MRPASSDAETLTAALSPTALDGWASRISTGARASAATDTTSRLPPLDSLRSAGRVRSTTGAGSSASASEGTAPNISAEPASMAIHRRPATERPDP